LCGSLNLFCPEKDLQAILELLEIYGTYDFNAFCQFTGNSRIDILIFKRTESILIFLLKFLLKLQDDRSNHLTFVLHQNHVLIWEFSLKRILFFQNLYSFQKSILLFIFESKSCIRLTHLNEADLSSKILEDAVDLIWKMIEINPVARISAADALQHIFFALK
jgi:serine/threonine protein kinase